MQAPQLSSHLALEKLRHGPANMVATWHSGDAEQGRPTLFTLGLLHAIPLTGPGNATQLL